MIEVEVIKQHKETFKCYSKVMTVEQWYNLNKKTGFYYKAYQLGFYQNKNKIEK